MNSRRNRPILAPSIGPGGQPEVVGWIDGETGEHHLYDTEALVQPSVITDADLPPLPPNRERRFFTVAQLGEPRPIEWLVDGWIANGELSVIYGQGDSYKSFLALHWALTAALAGRDVVYIAAEGAHGLRTRVPAWMRQNDRAQEDGTFPGFRVDELPLILDGDVDWWLAEVEDELGRGADWVIIDTLAMCFNGDENSAQDMGRFVRGCERIRRASDHRTAVTIIHHMGISTGRERGTAALRNASFSMIKLTRTGGGLASNVVCDRMKDAERPKKHRLNMVKVEWRNLRGEPVSSLAVKQFKEVRDD